MIARESGENAVGQRRLRSHARRSRTPDVISERHDVFGTLAQRRHTNAHDVEAIEQILPKAALGDFRSQVAIRGAHHPDVHLATEGRADTPDLLLLKDSQQLRLGTRREIGNLVEEQRAAVGLFDEAGAIGHRARERTFHVAKQLRLEQFVRQRRAVDVAESPLAPRAQVMQRARHEFFTRSALAFNEDRKRRRRCTRHGATDVCDRRARADELRNRDRCVRHFARRRTHGLDARSSNCGGQFQQLASLTGRHAIDRPARDNRRDQSRTHPHGNTELAASPSSAGVDRDAGIEHARAERCRQPSADAENRRMRTRIRRAEIDATGLQ